MYLINTNIRSGGYLVVSETDKFRISMHITSQNPVALMLLYRHLYEDK